MNVDVALLPRDLPQLGHAPVTVIVFDVLRATTTIAAAVAAAVREIRVFGSTAAARDGAASVPGTILCGEEQCLAPPGFDLGNSPGEFSAALHVGRTVCMSTTNGTRAILAAHGARRIFAGSLVNASAVARIAREAADDVILLCAGTNGEVAAEDVIGAGAVLHALRASGAVRLKSDAAWMAEQLFLSTRSDLTGALRSSHGGRNVIAAGLDQDIVFAARLDALDAVGEVHGHGPPTIRSAMLAAERPSV